MGALDGSILPYVDKMQEFGTIRAGQRVKRQGGASRGPSATQQKNTRRTPRRELGAT